MTAGRSSKHSCNPGHEIFHCAKAAPAGTFNSFCRYLRSQVMAEARPLNRGPAAPAVRLAAECAANKTCGMAVYHPNIGIRQAHQTKRFHATAPYPRLPSGHFKNYPCGL
jgi:hypothetical protein